VAGDAGVPAQRTPSVLQPSLQAQPPALGGGAPAVLGRAPGASNSSTSAT
jgi:hypothetical protein